MSAIFGIINLDNQPVNPNNLKLMLKSVVCCVPDASGTWIEGPVGLGHFMLFNTPESLHEVLPFQSKLGGLVLTADSRLDNRDELFSKLRIPHPERSLMPDSILILKAYERWGTEAPNHLLGDWAFCLWDAKRRQLFVARDHCGMAGLYYYRDDHLFAFASTLNGLFALPSLQLHLNPAAVAQFGPGRGVLGDTSTPYHRIHRLMPGQSMTVSSSKVEIQTYWSPAESPLVRFRSDRDYLNAFREIYSEAVRCRLRSCRPIGVMLSGGLDSGSIAAIAARELARSDKRLVALTSVPQYEHTKAVSANRCGDELSLVDSIARFAGNVDVAYIKAENANPLNSIERVLGILNYPVHGAANLYWMLALLDTARQHNLGVVLDGWGGNFTVSWNGNRSRYLLTLLKSWRWLKYFQELKAWQSAQQATYFKTFKSQVLKPFIPAPWLKQIQRNRSQRFSVLKKTKADGLSHYRHSFSPFPTEIPLPLRSINHSLQKGLSSTYSEIYAAYGLNAGQPAMDKRVLEFCLGLPQDQYTRQGRDRLLIKNVMADLMPTSVLWNDRRGKQAADIVQRIRANRNEIEPALHKLQTSPLANQWLDLPKMNCIFETLQHKLDPTITDETHILLKGLMIGLFLQRFEYN